MQERSAFKSYYLTQERQTNNYYSNPNDVYDARSYMPQETLPASTTSKVFVNPNYANRKPVIHVNPHVQVQPTLFVNPQAQLNSSIYLNPRAQMIPPIYANPHAHVEPPTYINPNLIRQNITNSQNQEQLGENAFHTNQPVQARIPSICAVHVNPKMMKLISNVPRENAIRHSIPSVTSFQSLPVGPSTLISQSELNSSNFSDQGKSIHPDIIDVDEETMPSTPISQNSSSENSNQLGAKFVKNNSTNKKSPNSSLVSLSRRKLVRIRRSPKVATVSSNSSRKRLSSSGSKKGKSSPRSTLISIDQLSKVNNLKSSKNVWYNKLDKTVLKTPKKKVISGKTVS